MQPQKQTIDVVIPVYSGFQDTKACIESVLNSHTDCEKHIIVVDDCSPDPNIVAYLDELARQGLIALLRNKKNLGFPGTANKGMQYHKNCDVVLLNSDTIVSDGWLDRIRRCADADPQIGTITPFSNNATICSFPNFNNNNELDEDIFPQQLDQIFAKVNAGHWIDIPTGIGFCMFIRRQCLEKVGYFNERLFDKGYGEENDLCFRLAAAGFRNVLCCDVFVYHAGGVSFGKSQQERQEKALKTILKLHPDYIHKVEKHIAQDPARLYRLTARLELIRQSKKNKILHVTHGYGGGTDKHVTELQNYIKPRAESLILHGKGNDSVVLGFDLCQNTDKLKFHLPTDALSFLEICCQLGIDRIHIHHTFGLPEDFWDIVLQTRLPFDITLHDYHWIAPTPTLTNEKGWFDKNQIAQARDQYTDVKSLSKLETIKQNLLHKASRIIAPSQSTAEIYRAVDPSLRIIEAYHPDYEKNAPYPSPVSQPLMENEPFKVLVIGALNLEKGADTLDECAKLAKKRNLSLHFHLLGYSYRIIKNHLEHRALEHITQSGPYHDQEAARLLTQYQPHLIWFPAHWPETYSYTLSLALQCGYPILAPDIGSFKDRLIGRPLTWIYPYQMPPEKLLTKIENIRAELLRYDKDQSAQIWHQPSAIKFYATEYCRRKELVDPVIPEDSFMPAQIAPFVYINKSRQFKEALLLYLVRFRATFLGILLSRFIPYKLQRRLKHLLSHRSMQEFME